jgi:hypothetical protein
MHGVPLWVGLPLVCEATNQTHACTNKKGKGAQHLSWESLTF